MTSSLDPEVAAVLQAALEKNGPPPTPPAGDVQSRRAALDAMLDYFNNQARPPGDAGGWMPGGWNHGPFEMTVLILNLRRVQDRHFPLAQGDDRRVGVVGVGDHARDSREPDHREGGDGAEFLAGREHVRVGRPADEETLHRRLVGIIGGKPLVDVDSGDAEQVDVG
jgi:hypothetical protein